VTVVNLGPARVVRGVLRFGPYHIGGILGPGRVRLHAAQGAEAHQLILGLVAKHVLQCMEERARVRL